MTTDPTSGVDLTFPNICYTTRLLASETEPERVVYVALDALANFSRSDRIAIVQLHKERTSSAGKVIGLLSHGSITYPNSAVRLDKPPFDKLMESKQSGMYRTASGTPCLCLPLIGIEHQLTGAVAIDRADDEPIPDLEMQILLIITTLIGIALEQSRYFHLATYDGLTGLFVRRHFDLRIQEEVARVRRHGGDLSLIISDIDHFKSFNDSYGHQQGDIVLKELATILRYSIRKDIDIPCRYGGEEFVVILPNTDLKGALQVAERFRKNCEQFPFSGQQKALRVTISCGVASMNQANSIDKGELVRRADAMLYEAKNTGRNRVKLWEQGEQS